MAFPREWYINIFQKAPYKTLPTIFEWYFGGFYPFFFFFLSFSLLNSSFHSNWWYDRSGISFYLSSVKTQKALTRTPWRSAAFVQAPWRLVDSSANTTYTVLLVGSVRKHAKNCRCGRILQCCLFPSIDDELEYMYICKMTQMRGFFVW